MYQININGGTVDYVNPIEVSGIKLAQLTIPSENETYVNKTTEEIIAETPLVNRLSSRNYKSAYIVPVSKTSVLLNMIPEKIIITDTSIREFIDFSFSYFTDDNPLDGQPAPFSLVDGIIFRCAGEGIKQLKDYTYFIMTDGGPQKIPNYQTLEVMLNERGMTYQSIRVLEQSQCQDLMTDTPVEIPDNSSSWSPSVSSLLDFSNYLDLKGAAASAGAIAGAAAAEADKNIAAVKAEADANKAASEAAQAQAQAAEAAAAAAQAQAQSDKMAAEAAIAQANAAQAEAEAAKAEADAKKAELDKKT